MELHPNLKPPRAPILDLPTSSEEEAKIANAIESNLSALRQACEELSVAIALFEFSLSQRDNAHESLFSKWKFLGAKQGAMSLRNFAVALDVTRGLVGRVPRWLHLVDVKSLKDSDKQFSMQFPFAHKLRHSVAHPEFYSDHTKDMSGAGSFDQIGIDVIGDCSITIKEMLHGRIFSATFDGQLIRYELAYETAETVAGITKDVFAAFARVDRLGRITRQL